MPSHTHRSAARRRAILDRLASWAPFSNSSPVEGVTKAIQRFYAADKKISLYVFGDDFSGGLMQDVVETVRRKNANGKASRVRIHKVVRRSRSSHTLYRVVLITPPNRNHPCSR